MESPDSLTYDWEYDDGEKSTHGNVTAGGIVTAEKKVLSVLEAEYDDVDEDALTIHPQEKH